MDTFQDPLDVAIDIEIDWDSLPTHMLSFDVFW